MTSLSTTTRGQGQRKRRFVSRFSSDRLFGAAQHSEGITLIAGFAPAGFRGPDSDEGKKGMQDG